MTKVMTVEGMMCGMCESHVAEALRKVPGVEKASASRSKKGLFGFGKKVRE